MNEYDNWLQIDPEQLKDLRRRVQERLGTERDRSDDEVRIEIGRTLSDYCQTRYLSIAERVRCGARLFASLRGFDVLQPLMEDESVTEIMVNGPQMVYVEQNGLLHRTGLTFDSKERLEDVIQQIVGQVNRQVNEFHPIADARLPGSEMREMGYRVNVILPPVALNGPILTIRKFRKEPITEEEMIAWGSLTREAADFLRRLVENRYNLFVCGGTGAGKTTLLNVLSNDIPERERIITIEDVAELRLSSLENVVTLETRSGGPDGSGQVTIRDLIKTSLRARPDRIIVGEVRGAEALDMLSAMNTGHDGSLSTGHANSAEDMISRLETMVLMGADLPVEAIRGQIASAIDIFVHIGRDGSLRRIEEISQVCGMEGGRVVLERLFQRENGELVRTGAVLRRQKGKMQDGLSKS